ncbi:MAG: MaoC family dehydratase [Burkholderiaceae bacterium]
MTGREGNAAEASEAKGADAGRSEIRFDRRAPPGPVAIAGLDALERLVGADVAISDWFAVDQARIDAFAQATGDCQWIHVDPERCRTESPFGGAVAHGFLTLSLLPAMMQQAIAMPDVVFAVNYGLNKVRFPAPVPAGARLRGRFRLRSLERVPGGAQLCWDVTVEREGGDKPVCVAEFVTRRYP